MIRQKKTPVLIKAALAHVQYETIHPFLNGNGRLGRFIITLLLCSEKVLKDPMLYFLADAVIHTAIQAVETAQQLMKLSAEDGQRISGSAHLIHKALLERPMASPNWIHEKMELSPATVNACLREMVSFKTLLGRRETVFIPMWAMFGL